MVTLGATLDDADRPILLTYLVRIARTDARRSRQGHRAQHLHHLPRPYPRQAEQHTAEEWEATLIAMLNEGAQLSDEDFPIVLRYLSRRTSA